MFGIIFKGREVTFHNHCHCANKLLIKYNATPFSPASASKHQSYQGPIWTRHLMGPGDTRAYTHIHACLYPSPTHLVVITSGEHKKYNTNLTNHRSVNNYIYMLGCVFFHLHYDDFVGTWAICTPPYFSLPNVFLSSCLRPLSFVDVIPLQTWPSTGKHPYTEGGAVCWSM